MDWFTEEVAIKGAVILGIVLLALVVEFGL